MAITLKTIPGNVIIRVLEGQDLDQLEIVPKAPCLDRTGGNAQPNAAEPDICSDVYGVNKDGVYFIRRKNNPALRVEVNLSDLVNPNKLGKCDTIQIDLVPLADQGTQPIIKIPGESVGIGDIHYRGDNGLGFDRNNPNITEIIASNPTENLLVHSIQYGNKPNPKDGDPSIADSMSLRFKDGGSTFDFAWGPKQDSAPTLGGKPLTPTTTAPGGKFQIFRLSKNCWYHWEPASRLLIVKADHSIYKFTGDRYENSNYLHFGVTPVGLGIWQWSGVMGTSLFGKIPEPCTTQIGGLFQEMKATNHFTVCGNTSCTFPFNPIAFKVNSLNQDDPSVKANKHNVLVNGMTVSDWGINKTPITAGK
ncbi:MAG: hypothetical protein K2X66_07590 [Cyanobacteria bacterium]|nr:hypothetical protein [Cyanobacteriota bacterium]